MIRRLHPPVPIDDIAAMVGWEPSRVRRRLLKLNEELGGMLLVNIGGTGRGARWACTWASLRRACPDWFDGQKSDAETIDELRVEVKTLGVQVHSLARAYSALEKRVGESGLESTKRRA